MRVVCNPYNSVFSQVGAHSTVRYGGLLIRRAIKFSKILRYEQRIPEQLAIKFSSQELCPLGSGPLCTCLKTTRPIDSGIQLLKNNL